ncbi:MAG: lantibiotic dehydratase [Verrucomicrobiota bacterium]
MRIGAERIFRARDNGLSAAASHALRGALRTGKAPVRGDGAQPAEFTLYADAADKVEIAELRIQECLEREIKLTRTKLLELSRKILPPYLVFGSASVRELVRELISENRSNRDVAEPRNTRARKRERHLLLYLQRICAKNDTFSTFGPHSWGTILPGVDALQITPGAGVTEREVFLERWTAHATSAALNADSNVRAELAPRLNPNGRIEGNSFVFADTDENIPLNSEALRILARCDGQTPAYSLGVPLAELEELARQNILCWEVEVPALEPHAFDVLLSDVSGWREGATRARWLEALVPIAATARTFSAANDIASRIQIMREARERLEQFGGEHKLADRSLYSARNPIGEDCFRETGCVIGEKIAEQFVVDAEPWIDLWRDSYALIADRVAAGLRRLMRSAPVRNDAVPLPAFLRHCEAQKIPLTSHGLVGLAAVAFQEIKSAFRAITSDRDEAPEWQLTAEDCHFVRKNFGYTKFDEYTFPSADLQISASSPEGMARGEYEWILGELHPPVALLHHCVYWSCPAKPEFARALASTVKGRPNFHFGVFAADFTAHTTVRHLDAMPNLTSFVAPQRGNPCWRNISPAEAEVYIEEQTGDICVRLRSTREHLGSFARSWVIPLGFHPFHFARIGHTPRLRCGKVVVQRRCWTVSQADFGAGKYTGVSKDLAVAIERLRAEKDLPRFVYIRPTEQALRRSGAEGRDKDTKPVFIDLESYLFLEIFCRWLTKSGELEVTEMLPDPDHLLWKEADGRRTFELRTLIVPRA